MRVSVGAGLRALVAVFLLVAAFAKASDFAAFEDAMRVSALFPELIRVPAAYAVIVAELVLSLWLFSGKKPSLANLFATALGGLFLGYSLWRYRMGIPSPCHCLGFLARLGPVQSVELSFCFWSLSALATLAARPDALASRGLLKLRSDSGGNA